MYKSVIIELDELNNPIRVNEIREYRDLKSFENMSKMCDENNKKYKERLKLKEQLEKEKHQALINEINALKEEIKLIKADIAYLKGE